MKRALLLAALAGCNSLVGADHFTTGDGGGSDGSNGSDAIVDNGDVTGTAIDIFHSWNGTTTVKTPVPRDLSGGGISALVVAADGTITSYPGTGDATGHFTISGVPDGPFILRFPPTGISIGPYFVYCENRKNLDMGLDGIGDGTPTSTDAQLVSITGALPVKWSDADYLQDFSPAKRGSQYQSFVSGGPAPGATSLADATISRTNESVLDNSELWLVHTTDKYSYSPDGAGYDDEYPVAYMKLTGQSQPASGPLVVNQGFMFRQQTTFPLAANIGALRAALGTSFMSDFAIADIWAAPDDNTNTFAGPFTLEFQRQLPIVAPPMENEAVPYTDPFTNTWSRSLTYGYTAYRRYFKIAGANSHTVMTVDVEHDAGYHPQIDPPAIVTIDPSTLPAWPHNIMVDGVPDGDRRFPKPATKATHLTFDAVPGAQMYLIALYHISQSGGTSSTRTVASLHTTKPEAWFPPDVFQDNSYYAFYIAAITSPAPSAWRLPAKYDASVWETDLLYVSSTCGNGTSDPGEACDPGAAATTAMCNFDCTLSACNDGKVNAAAGETCDAGMANTTCSSTCTMPTCGDGHREGLEECDDGNQNSGDGCSAMCKRETGTCGDHVINIGEQCDDGNTASNDGCSATCQVEYCGDHVMQTNEQCDDGNQNGGDGCSASCTLE